MISYNSISFCGGDILNMEKNDSKEDDPDNFYKFFGLKNSYKIEEDSISNFLKFAEKEGLILPYQKNMMERILNFELVYVEDIMMHRINIKAVKVDSKLEDVINIYLKFGFSKVPVFQDRIDNIVGVVYVKEILKAKRQNSDLKLSEFIREIIFVPETMRCKELVKKFEETNSKIAVVVDEYGGTAGIVGLKDVYEFVFKGVEGTYKNKNNKIEKIDDFTVLVDGDLDLEKIFKLLDISIEKTSNFDTVGGFIANKLGKIPQPDEHPVIKLDEFCFEVVLVNKQHIEKVKITKTK